MRENPYGYTPTGDCRREMYSETGINRAEREAARERVAIRRALRRQLMAAGIDPNVLTVR